MGKRNLSRSGLSGHVFEFEVDVIEFTVMKVVFFFSGGSRAVVDFGDKFIGKCHT